MNMPESPAQADIEAEERKLRWMELAQKRRELAARRSRIRPRDFISSPVFATAVAGVIGLFANALVGFLNSRWNRQLEQDKAEATLILRATEAPDSLQRVGNLGFYLAAGLLRDENGR